MKNRIYESLKTRKPFETCDVFVYVFILILLFTLSIFFVFSPKSESSGFKAEVDGKTVFEFDYTNETYEIFEDFNIDVNLEENTVTIYFDEQRTEYNVLLIDTENKSVKVTESTCSNSRECTRIPAVKDSSGSIYCTPHKLKIVSLSNSANEPVTGA